MHKVFEGIFDSLLNDLDKNIESFRNNKLPDSSTPRGFGTSDSKEFTFHLDDNGQCSKEFSAYGAGTSIRYSLTIFSPEALYCVTIKSSDGGGGIYTDVSPNQPLQGVIKTSFWHSTTLKLAVKANVSNVDVLAKIEYNY